MKRLLLLMFSLALISTGQALVWDTVPSPGTFDNIELFMSGEDMLYAGGIKSKVYGSTDHGETWTEIAGGLEEDYSPIWDMIIVDDWFIMSRDGFGDYNFRSRRVAGEWQAWEATPVQEGRIDHLCAIGSSVFGVFYGGGIRRTDDYGLSWTPIEVPDAETIWRIFAEEGRLFVSGNEINGGSIWRSDDLGASWVDVGTSLNSSFLCSEIYWKGQLLICVYNGGGDGTFYTSTDFGESWMLVTTLPTDDNVNAMAITDGGLLAIGDSSGHDGESMWLTHDLVNWTNYNGNLSSYAGAFGTLICHDGWFFKTGGVQGGQRAPQPEPTNVDDTPASFPGELVAWPNPFNPKTTLRFVTDSSGWVELDVFDLTGRRVSKVFGGHLPAGPHEYNWLAEDLASGVYLARIKTQKGWSAEKLVLLQ
ncbi:T9SS type A sorting domain-containing protein [bacterium]|nr:T9SS type A sorting domain-containing protein [bacterium]